MGMDSFNIARTVSKALKRRSTLYATGAICEGDTAYVMVTMNGRRFKVLVSEIEDEWMDSARSVPRTQSSQEDREAEGQGEEAISLETDPAQEETSRR